ncbi:MAG: hypothetical protein QNJ31_02060 [Candidatus Caenarcaniphilales bacterium]|nr:hypothetical protein [Candidatus Caenarcaniphilales bacterium]
MKKFFLFLNLLFIFFTSTSAFSIDLLKITDFSKSPRFIKIKIPFDSAQADLGVHKNGFIADKEKKYSLKSLKKYKIKLNASASYSLYSIENEREKLIGQLKLPILVVDNSIEPAVYFNKHWYHGQIKIDSFDSGIVGINGLDIEQAIAGIIGPLTRVNDSVDAIKSAAVIARSSLFTLGLTSIDQYHLNGSLLNYQGVSGEKNFVNNLIKDTEGEVLYSIDGELLYTPLRATAKEGSLPFELIGKDTKAWEKVFELEEIERILNSNGSYVGVISSIKQKPIKSSIDPFAMQNGPVLSIVGSNSSFQISSVKAKDIFKLPTEFFRVYSYVDERGINKVQFIGSILSAPYYSQEPTFNLVRSIYELSKPYENYRSILKKMYPESYLGRV